MKKTATERFKKRETEKRRDKLVFEAFREAVRRLEIKMGVQPTKR